MKILLGMSGGVDSTYSALKLIREGHTVEGCVLVMHDCTDVCAAKTAAEELGIPLHVLDLKDEFDRVVKPYFVNEYLNGRTPNPCIVCNPEIKFKYLREFAINNGFDKIATWHYAKIVKTPEGRYAVSIADDRKKDQSYMLSRLGQDILSMLVLPLSDMDKDKVRTDSEYSNLSASRARDSQEICFIPDGNYAEYIEAASFPSKKGSFISERGDVLGEHNGIIRYTVGQRKGLGISLGERVFVTDISPENNTVTLSASPSLDGEVYIDNAVYSGICEPSVGTELTACVKLRYLAPPASCKAACLENGKIHLRLDAPARSVTPGQAAVLYDGDRVIASGFICKKP